MRHPAGAMSGQAVGAAGTARPRSRGRARRKETLHPVNGARLTVDSRLTSRARVGNHACGRVEVRRTRRPAKAVRSRAAEAAIVARPRGRMHVRMHATRAARSRTTGRAAGRAAGPAASVRAAMSGLLAIVGPGRAIGCAVRAAQKGLGAGATVGDLSHFV